MRLLFYYIYILLLSFSANVFAQEKNKFLHSLALTDVYARIDTKQSTKIANKPLIGISLGFVILTPEIIHLNLLNIITAL